MTHKNKPECAATPLGLGTDFRGMFTQGSSRNRNPGLEDAIPLGLGSMSLDFVGFVSLV